MYKVLLECWVSYFWTVWICQIYPVSIPSFLFISKIACYVWSGTLNLTHSLTPSLLSLCVNIPITHNTVGKWLTHAACNVHHHSPDVTVVMLSWQAMETSSLWLQSLTPQPLCRQLAMLVSEPVHCTPSSQILVYSCRLYE